MELNLDLTQILRNQKIRILVVDDRSHFRSLIRQLIDSEADMMVIGEADDEGSAIDETRMLPLGIGSRGDEVLLGLTQGKITARRCKSSLDNSAKQRGRQG